MSLLSTCFVIGILVYSISVLVLYWLFRNDIIYNKIKEKYDKKLNLEPNPELYKLGLDSALQYVMLTPILNTIISICFIIEIVLMLIWNLGKFIFVRKKK